MDAIRDAGGHRHLNIQNTTRCTALAPDRFKGFWRDLPRMIIFASVLPNRRAQQLVQDADDEAQDTGKGL
jgi:hypothetical protein